MTAALAPRLGSRFMPLGEVLAARHRVLRADRGVEEIVSAPLAGVGWRRRLCARLALMHGSAHGGDPVVIAQGRAGLPAVANLLVLVAQRGSSRWLACA